MSTRTPPEESPRIPWLYLGALLLPLIGFGLSFIVGVFLITLAGNCASELSEAGGGRVDFRAFTWAIAAVFGVGSLLLAVLPMFVPNEPGVELPAGEGGGLRA